MIKKRNLLKGLLATASTMAVLASGIHSTGAAISVTGAANVNWSTGANTDRGATLADDDVLQYGGAHTAATGGLDSSGFVNGVAIDLNGTNAGLFSIGDATKIKEIVNAGGANNIPVQFTAAVVTTITAANDGVGVVDFNNKAATLTIGDAFTTKGAIDSAAGGPNGTLNLVDAATIGHRIGATNALALVDFQDTATINSDVRATNTKFGGVTNIGATANVTVTSDAELQGDHIITLGSGGNSAGIDGALTTMNNGEGTLIFANNASAVTGAIGAAANALSEVRVADGVATVLQGDVFATNTNIGNGSTLTIGANTITGAVDGVGAGQGVLVFNDAASAVTGAIGAIRALAKVQVEENHDLAADVTATNVTVDKTHTLTIGDNTITGDVDGVVPGNAGGLTFNKANSVVDGHIGNNQALAAVNVQQNYTTRGNVKATDINLVDNKTLSIKDGTVVEGAIANGGLGAAVELAGAATLSNAGGNITNANVTLELDAGHALTSAGGTFQGAVTVAAAADQAIPANTADVTFTKLILKGDNAELVSETAARTLGVTAFDNEGTAARKLAKVTIKSTAKQDLQTNGGGAKDSIAGIEEVVFENNGELTLQTAADHTFSLPKVTNFANSGVMKFTPAGGTTLTLSDLAISDKLNKFNVTAETVKIADGGVLKATNVILVGDLILDKNVVVTADTVNGGGAIELGNNTTVEGTVTADVTQTAGTATQTVKGKLTGNVTLSVADSTFTVEGAHIGEVNAVGGIAATFALNGSSDKSEITLNGAKDLTSLVLDSDQDVTLTTNAVGNRAKKVTVKGSTKLILANDNQGTEFVVDSADHTIESTGNQTLGAYVAAAGEMRTLGTEDIAINLVDNGNHNYTFSSNTATHYINFTNTGPNHGNVIFAAAADPAGTGVKLVGNIGTLAQKYGAVTFDDGSGYTGEAYVNTKFAHVANATVTLEDATLVGEYQFAGAGNLHLKGKTKLDKVTAAAGANIYASGTATSTADWGTKAQALALVDVADDASMTMGGVLYADNLKLGKKATFVAGGNTTTNLTVAEGATLNVNGYDVTLTTLTLNGNMRVAFKDGATAGSVEFVAVPTNPSDYKVAFVIPTTDAAKAEKTEDMSANVKFDGGVSAADKAKVEAMYADGTDLTAVPYEYQPTEAEQAAQVAAVADATTIDAAQVTTFTAAEVARVQKLALAAQKAGINIAALTANLDENRETEAVARVLTKDSSAASAASVATGSIATAVSNAATANISTRVAAAAGDNSIPYGAWLSAIGGQATQKATSKTPVGYKSNLFGGTIGFDAEVAEGTLVGIAGTYAKGKVKLKNAKVGDKADTKTMMVNLYAQQNITDDVFVQGMVGYAQTDVKAKSKRVVSNTANETVKTKYKVKGYSASLLGGYSMAIGSGVSFTPMAGVKFGKLDQGNIKESGNTTNLATSVKHKNKFTGVVGARLATVVDSGNMVLTPEAHAFLDYNLGSKKAAAHKVGLAADSARVSQTIEHASKYAVNVGASVTAKSGMMEYGVGYDASIAKKFVGHQGSLKVRVNF